jgi:hypothetical protein
MWLISKHSCFLRTSWLLPAALACVLATSWSAHAGSSYLAVWSSDKETNDPSLNTDFLAIIDADPRSPTYGKVMNTASLQNIPARTCSTISGLRTRSA